MRRLQLGRACALVGIYVFGVIGCTEQAEQPVEHPGLQVYVKYCASCHNAGVADAPKLGDRDEWLPRIEKGRQALFESTHNGIPPAMPKKGLCLSCSDAQLNEAIDYMLHAVRTSDRSN